MLQTILKFVLNGTLLLCCFSGYSSESKEWGKPVNGVRMSLSLTNDILQIDATESGFICITNSSTNSIIVYPGDRGATFELYIVNQAGSAFKISREPAKPTNGAVYGIYAPISIGPHESQEWVVSITLDKKIMPGQCMLKATQRYYRGDNGFDLTSNPLRISIK